MEPTTLKYTPTHEWVHLDGDVATLGISKFAVDQLTDLIVIDLPKVGATLTQGKPFGEVESVKAVSDLYSPISGTVTAINEELNSSPDKVNEDAHHAWMIKVELSDLAEVEKLLDAAAYEAFIAEETGH